MKLVDEGIFLFRTNYSDTSLIATFYTKEKGLKKFIFKGGKKKSHNLFPLSLSELTYYERKESDLSNLTNVDPSSVQTFQFDPVRSTIAFFIAEVIRKSVETHDKDADLYSFLTQALGHLQNDDDISLIPLKFMIGFSEQLGIQPLLDGPHPSINFKEGSLGNNAMASLEVEMGEHVQLIIDMYDESSTIEHKELRTKALKTMIKYFSYHIPRMENVETLEIVQEILS